MAFPLAAALPVIGKVIDRVLPDKAAKDAAKLALYVSRTTSGLRNQAFNAATALIQSDQNRALQAAQANQQAALQRAQQQAQLEQETNRQASELAQQRALQQAQLRQQAASTNADLTLRGRLADIDSRYTSDRQRLGAIQGFADATLQAQQLSDQRTLQNAALLNDIGTQQQQNTQAQLDAPFRALEIRNSTLSGTPFPQTQITTTENRGGGKGGLLGGLGSLASGVSQLASLSHSSAKHKIDDFSNVLEKLNELDIIRWRYKGRRPFSDGQNHVGPMAEDVNSTFDIGDGITLNLFDLMGIVLAAIKELNSKLNAVVENPDES